MPSYFCSHATCQEILPAKGYCAAHKKTGKSRHYFYDRHQRDRDGDRFYHSAAWTRLRALKLANNPVCELCGHLAEHVHHKESIKAAPDLRLAMGNLQSVCNPCHSTIHANQRNTVG